MDVSGVFNLNDFEAIAREVMEDGAFAYFAGGSWQETTLRENVEAFGRFRLRPRVLVDASRVDTSTTLLGSPVAMPLGLAPAALQRLAHDEGELASAAAAADAALPFCVSTLSSYSVEEIAAASKGPTWMQLYIYKDRGLTRDLVQRAEAAGCRAIVLTVDLPVSGYRERELRRDYHVPPSERFGNFPSIEAGGDDLMSVIAGLHDQSLTWADVDWLRGLTSLPVAVKGILRGDDAALAVEHGAAAVAVSNHGGRQLDRAPASIDVLSEIVAAVDGRAEVYLDGGVRRGTDVIVALALGARAAFIGRPYLYALAAGGRTGVTRALALLRAELETAMRLLGVTAIDQIGAHHVTGPSPIP